MMLGIFLAILITFSCLGCGVGIVAGVEATLTAAEIAGEIAEKVDDIHKSGADQKVLDDVHAALSEAHVIIDRHHKAHVREKKSVTPE